MGLVLGMDLLCQLYWIGCVSDLSRHNSNNHGYEMQLLSVESHGYECLTRSFGLQTC